MQTRLPVIVLVLALSTVAAKKWPAAAAEAEPGVDASVLAVIRDAGNEEDDARRVDVLKRLRDMPGLPEQLRSEAERMVAEADRWANAENLAWFSRSIGRTMDYDFGVARSSPLYPLTCLYRGRMLVWETLESGNIIRYEDRRRQFLDKAVAEFRLASEAFPENRIVKMYRGEPIRAPREFDVPSNCPAWAAAVRDNLENLTAVIHWWIDRRMRADGQYGGGWGDDCEMWRWWTPVLVGFEDPKINQAQARFSAALMALPHMRRGYTSQYTDVEHSAEDSSDVITPMMHIAAGDRVWRERALRLADLAESLWMGTNARGTLQFKSTYFNVERVSDNPAQACDTVYHPRALQPALLLWQRTGDPRLTRLFTAWMDTWVEAAARAERGKPAGIIPSAIHWPDAAVGGTGPDWWDPRNHGEPTLYQWPSAMSMICNTLLLTHHMTGKEKYLAPLRSMAAARLRYLRSGSEAGKPGSESWCAAELGFLAGTLAKHKLLTGAAEFDELLARDGSGLGGLAPADDRRALARSLERSAEALRTNRPGYTSEVRYTDRVLRFPVLFTRGMMFTAPIDSIAAPDTQLLYSVVTGDPGDCGYFPLNAVRWRTPPGQIACLVTRSGRDRFTAELYHFGASPRRMSADLYLLAPGTYRATLEPLPGPSQGESIKRFSVKVNGPSASIPLELPPQRPMRLDVVRQ